MSSPGMFSPTPLIQLAVPSSLLDSKSLWKLTLMMMALQICFMVVALTAELSAEDYG